MDYLDKILLVDNQIDGVLGREIDKFIGRESLPYAIKGYWRMTNPYINNDTILELTMLTLNKILNGTIRGCSR